MPETYAPVTEAEILAEVIPPDRPGRSPESARAILELRFNETAREKMSRLASKNNQGTLTEAERVEMEKYVRVGTFLDLMQAKARLSLQEAKPY
jgi:hypothetical protein